MGTWEHGGMVRNKRLRGQGKTQTGKPTGLLFSFWTWGNSIWNSQCTEQSHAFSICDAVFKPRLSYTADSKASSRCLCMGGRTVSSVDPVSKSSRTLWAPPTRPVEHKRACATLSTTATSSVDPVLKSSKTLSAPPNPPLLSISQHTAYATCQERANQPHGPRSSEPTAHVQANPLPLVTATVCCSIRAWRPCTGSHESFPYYHHFCWMLFLCVSISVGSWSPIGYENRISENEKN